MVASAPIAPAREDASGSRLSAKIAALVGASGAALTGEAMAGTLNPAFAPYTPTAGVMAAQNGTNGIPGFSFTSPTNITLGSLRPPATTPYNQAYAGWDINGDGTDDLGLLARYVAGGNPASSDNRASFGAIGNGLLGSNASVLASLNIGAQVSSLNGNWNSGGFWMTTRGSVNFQNVNGNTVWSNGTPGYFGFKFFDYTDYFTKYGWGQLVIDPGSTGMGQNFSILQAYYQSAPFSSIQVGQVPGGSPVPELPANTSALSLLAFGAAGLETLRNRKKQASTVA